MQTTEFVRFKKLGKQITVLTAWDAISSSIVAPIRPQPTKQTLYISDIFIVLSVGVYQSITSQVWEVN